MRRVRNLASQGKLAAIISLVFLLTGNAIATDAQNYVDRGIQLREHGDLLNALESFNRAVNANPQDESALFERAGLLGLLGNLTDAIADYDHILKNDPQKTKAWVYRADLKTRAGDNAGAIKDVNQGIKLDPKDAEAFETRGLVENQLLMFDKAVTDFDTALKMSNTAVARARILKNRALTKNKLGNKKGAMEDISQSISTKPEAQAYFLRGLFKRDCGDPKGADGDFGESSKLKPKWTERVKKQLDLKGINSNQLRPSVFK